MVGPHRQCRVVDTGVRKELDLEIHVPVESMVEPDATPAPGSGSAGGRARRRAARSGRRSTPSCSSSSAPHKSTIMFVNNRRSAERIALRLNEMAGEELARSHHGSLAREERTVVEEMLKAGELPCLVATSSLELGIDMGAVDLVIQVESPKSVARGLQRIGRAGHSVGDVSRGRIFPKFRSDLLECAVVARRMREAQIETTVVPRNPLDVLAQQIVAIAAAAGEDETVAVDDLYALVTRTHSYAELSRVPVRERARHARRALPVQRVRRAAPADRVGPRRRHDPAAPGRPPAGRHQRRHDPRPRPVRGHAARRPPRRRARRGDDLRGPPGPDVPARRHHLAHRGDRPRPGDRHAGARACRGRSRSGRATASAARGSWARRSAPSPAGRWTSRPRRSSATTTWTAAPRATWWSS